MNGYDERLLQSFRRTKGFFGEREALITATGTGPKPALVQQVATFDDVVAAFEGAAAEQESAVRARKGATVESRRLRAELRAHHLAPVARVAQSAIPDVVKMTEALRLPKANTTREQLLAKAESMAKAGEQYKTRLVESGLSADFVEELRGAAEAYKAAIDAQGKAVGNRTGATERLREARAAGRRTLDAIAALVKRQLSTDPAALAEFRQITRVTVKGVRGSVVPAAVAVNGTEVKTAA